MSLVALIDKHKTDLAVAWEAETQEVVDKYRVFGSELVRLPSFTYTRDDMKTAVAHMMGLDFNRHARYEVASYAMRRAAMEVISNVSDREEMFRIWDIASLDMGNEGMPRLREAVQGIVGRIGKPKVEDYLSKVQESFKVVAAEVDETYKISKRISADPKADKKAKLLAEQTAENHGQHIAIERSFIMEDVLNILRQFK